MRRGIFLLAALVPMLAAAAPRQVADFIRVDEDAGAARLQTALTRYEKNGVTVDLIGAVHIADKGYYRELNRRFDGYEALLFEMIGGRPQDRAGEKGKGAGVRKKEAPAVPAKSADDNGSADDAAADAGALDAIHQAYGLVCRFLALSDQMSNIDYTKKNFVHADLSLGEFERLQAERGETVLGFALEAGRKAEKEGNLTGPDLPSLMRAVMSGNPNAVKLEIVHTLGQGDDQIAAFAGNSVIIGDRNAKCLRVLGEQVKRDKHKLGIFYGAAHFPDMEKRLLKLGYKRVKQEWLTAWEIPKAKPAAEEKKEEPKAVSAAAG